MQLVGSTPPCLCMARNQKPFLVRLVHLEKSHILEKARWQEYVQRTLLVPVLLAGVPSHRIAEPAPGVIAQILPDRTLAFWDLRKFADYSIPSSWRLIERAMLFANQGRFLSLELLQREIQEQYAGPESQAREIERRLNDFFGQQGQLVA